MYQVFVDGNLMHDANIDDLVIFNPSLNLEQNAIGSFEFDMQNTHPYYSNMARMKSVYEVYYGNKVISKGRVIDLTQDTYKTQTVYCEDVLGYFIDSIQSPYDFSGSITEFLTQIINTHNSQVDDFKKFKIGTITVTDPNDYITRSDTTYLNTWDTLKKKLVELLGGYLHVRFESDGMYLDYLSDYTTLNSQAIRFGENLLTVKQVGSAADIATVVIPLGAKLEGSETKLTIADVNEGKIYLEDTDAIAKYGRITQTVEFQDVEVASNLKTKGQEYLNEVKQMPLEIEISAVDMASVDLDINRFALDSKIHVISDFHGIDEYFTPLKLSIKLFQPESNKVTLSSSKPSLTEGEINNSGMVVDRIETVESNFNTNIANQITNLMNQLSSIIEQSASEIRLEVSENYYNKGDTDELIQQTKTAFIQDLDSFEFQFNQFKQDIGDVINGNNAEFEDIRKYIRFENGDINLGQIGNEFQCWIAKDKISFYQGANEVAYFKYSKLYVDAIEIITSLQIGKFQYIPRTNGNLSFKWVG